MSSEAIIPSTPTGARPSEPDAGEVVHPLRGKGLLLGAAASAWALLLALLLVWRGVSQEVSLSAFLCQVAAAVLFFLGCLFLYWTFALARLRYVLDRNALTVHWGFVRQVIPMDKIEKVITGHATTAPQIAGVNWPGYHVGAGSVELIDQSLFYSAHSGPGDLVYVVTPEQTYALSVPNAEAFRKAVEALKGEGSEIAMRQVPRRSGPAAQAFWEDRLAKGLALLGIVLWFAAFGVIAVRYPHLSQSLAISFPPLDVTRVADKSELLTLPRTAFGLLAINLVLGFVVHGWERMIGRLLLVALVGSQALFLIAALIAVS